MEGNTCFLLALYPGHIAGESSDLVSTIHACATVLWCMSVNVNKSMPIISGQIVSPHKLNY